MRLKRASMAEVFYRAKHRIENKQLRRRAFSEGLTLPVPCIPRDDWAGLLMPDIQVGVDSIEPEELLKGKIYTLNTGEDSIGQFETRWRNIFSGDIKYNGALADIRAIWEPARLQHLAKLIIAGQISQPKDVSRIEKAIRDGILDWLEKNPFLLGPHYISPMECGLRLPVFVYALITRNHWSDEDRDMLLDAVYKHGWWVAGRLSLYASLGNHTICESIGLIFAGAVYRKTAEGKKWLEKGISLLQQELSHQVMEDGGPNEQSFNYHRFVLDLYRLAADFLEKNGLYDCTLWKPRLTKGENFLKTFMDASGNVPSIGDSDDGYALAPCVYPKRGDDDFMETRPCVTFPESGYTVIQSAKRLLFTFDHGSLGMAPLYNHGHADALSISLSVAGEQVLVDSGTYRYNGEPEWRRYFKGTRAHNTVNIDGADQAVQETGFIWSHPYKAELLSIIEKNGSIILEAGHDGYARLKHPVYHKRTVILLDASCFVIRDLFSGKGNHNFELNFHLHPDASVQSEDAWLSIRKNNAKVNTDGLVKSNIL